MNLILDFVMAYGYVCPLCENSTFASNEARVILGSISKNEVIRIQVLSWNQNWGSVDNNTLQVVIKE